MKIKRYGHTLYACPLIVSMAPPPSMPYAPWCFQLVVLVFWCDIVFMSTVCDLITLTSKSHQTHVIGAGWARVTQSQPIPAQVHKSVTFPRC